jgi:hypothetical protein
MKIRTLILLALISFSFSKSVNAQLGAFSLRLNIGYGLPAAPEYYWTESGTEQKVITSSMGSGGNLDIGGTYMIGDHLGAGLDLNYMMGTPVNYSHIYNGITRNVTRTGTFGGVTPMLIITANTPVINPYGRFGLVVATASFTEKSTESGTNAYSGTFIDNYNGGIAFGWYAAFGIQVPISTQLSMNFELYDRTMNYAPTKLVNTQAFDGQQKYTDITFVNKITESSPSDQELKSYYPFSSVGLKVGLVYTFGLK